MPVRHSKKCLILSRGAASAANRGGIHLSKNRPGLNARSGGRKTVVPLYPKGVCCVILHKKTQQEEGVGLGSGGLARGYGF